MLTKCIYEAATLVAVRGGGWAAEPELQAHARECRACREVAVVAGALTAAAWRDELTAPAPGLLWWRAQLQRRNAAVAKATRPLTWAAWVAMVLVVGAIGAAAWFLRDALPQALPRWSWSMPLLLGGAAVFVLCTGVLLVWRKE